MLLDMIQTQVQNKGIYTLKWRPYVSLFQYRKFEREATHFNCTCALDIMNRHIKRCLVIFSNTVFSTTYHCVIASLGEWRVDFTLVAS